MDMIILIGSVIFAIGIIIQAVNTKWSWKLGGYYGSKNKGVALVGWVIIIIGLTIIVLKAMANGQLN